jgi:diphthamide biosynthesis protein 4
LISTSTHMTSTPNLYHILGLSPPSNSSTPPHPIATLKAAYHRALLTHHPDKSIQASTPTSPSIDAIKSAYTILSNPKTRISYDQTLLFLNQPTTTTNTVLSDALTGEERIDLDDLTYDATTSSYFRACRCGESRGHEVRERDLEVEAARGARELLVQCGGCSLWLRVEFDMVDDDAEEEEHEHDGHAGFDDERIDMGKGLDNVVGNISGGGDGQG